ncbi:MAG: type II secretion system GspH family protein [Phycisphaerales bacterium]|nr:type II secretion system GspH family protein [Phycisphaerales bacterium]
MVTRRAFTLIELLAVVAILGIVGVITVVAYTTVSADVRRTSAVEQVKALLGQARALALESGTSTMVAFRARNVNGFARMEAIIAQPAGDSAFWQLPDGASPTPMPPGHLQQVKVSRFVPVEGTDPVLLPRGTEVAVPGHALSNPDSGGGSTTSLPYSGDIQYLPPTHMGQTVEATGVMPGIIFARDGAAVTGVPEHQSRFGWVDLDRDGRQGLHGAEWIIGQGEYPPCDGCFVLPLLSPGSGAAQTNVEYPEWWPLCQETELDEPWVTTGPFLVVYDADELRQVEDARTWSPTRAGAADRAFDHTRFIDGYGRRLFFNRFSGVGLEEADR